MAKKRMVEAEENKGADLKVSRKKVKVPEPDSQSLPESDEPRTKMLKKSSRQRHSVEEKEMANNLKKNEEAQPVSTPRSEKASPLKKKTKKKPVTSGAGTARHEEEPRRKISRTEESRLESRPDSEDTNANNTKNLAASVAGSSRNRHLDDEKEETETSISQNDGAVPESRPDAEDPKTDKVKTPSISRGLSGRKLPREDKKEEMETKVSMKKDSKGETEPRPAEKKQLIQRIWSDEDETVLLKGITDFKSEKKSDPFIEIDNFLDFIKDKIHIQVTKVQLQNKMKRIKRKYEIKQSQEKNKKEATFLKPRELESSRLSKAAWRVEGWNEIGSIDSGRTSVRELLEMRRHLIRSDDKVFAEADNWLMGRSRSTEEEMEWKNLLIAEIETFLAYHKSRDARAKYLLRASKSEEIH